MTWSSAAFPAAMWSSILRGTDPRSEFLTMVQIASDRFARLMRGIDAYQQHPYRRTLPEPSVYWQCEGMQVLDYGLQSKPDAPPLLIVPSLINRHYILDLRENHSFVRFLAAQGFRPLVVAWDGFGHVAEPVTIEACITRMLEPALIQILRQTGQRPALIGYCLGGLLTLALATRRPDGVAAQVFMATPWDFHAGNCRLAETAANALAMIEPTLQALGSMPVDAVQVLFYAIDPFHVIEKFLTFADIDPASDEAAAFVALEDWLNDGLPLTAPITRTLLGAWYTDNAPAHGEWSVAGTVISPLAAYQPAYVLVPQQDRIVPPASAEALGAMLPNAVTQTVETGHIGMVSSHRAPVLVWQPLTAWLHNRLGSNDSAP